MSAGPLVSFVIPVRNDARRLQRCLESIRRTAASADQIELVVADNGSTDDSAQVARDAGARVVPLPDRRVAEMRNVAARTTRGDVIAFIDADHEIVTRWLASAMETLDSTGAVAVGAQYHAPADGTWVQKQYDRLRVRGAGIEETSWLPSGNLAVRRTAFEHVDGFDANLETCEDVDFCQRLRTAGGRVISDPRLESTHFGDPATLRKLFMGELWRGRDNIRVTLRSPLAIRDVIGLLVPITELTLLALFVVGAMLVPFSGPFVILAAAAGLVVLTILQSIRMLRSGSPARLIDCVQTFAVAGVYGVARALALVARASHKVRHQGNR